MRRFLEKAAWIVVAVLLVSGLVWAWNATDIPSAEEQYQQREDDAQRENAIQSANDMRIHEHWIQQQREWSSAQDAYYNEILDDAGR